MAAIAVVALFVPLATASTQLTSSALSFPEATAIEGTLSGLDYRPDGAAGAAALKLVADRLEIETDVERPFVAGELGVSTEEPTTETAGYSQAELTAAMAGGEAGLFIDPNGNPLPKLGVPTSGLAVNVPEVACLQQPMYFDRPRAPLCPTVANAASVSIDGAGRFYLNGSFTMALWAWEGQISEGGTVTEFWTGNRPMDPVPAGVPAGRHEQRHMFIKVVDGSLQIDGLPSTPPTLFLQTARMTTAGPILLEGSTSPQVNGTAVVDIARGPQGVRLNVIEGQVAGVAVAPRDRPWWPWATAATAVILVLAVMAARPNTNLSRARQNFGIGNFNAAARQSQWAMRAPWLRKEAGVLATISLLRAGETEAAGRFLADMPRWGPEPAAMSYLNAFVLATQGRVEEGRRALAECIRLDPAYRTEAVANPALAPLLPQTPDEGGYT